MKKKNTHQIKKCAVLHQNTYRCNHCLSRFVCLCERITSKEANSVPKVIFNIPNTKEGNIIFNKMKSYLNDDRYTMKRYGRGKERQKNGGGQSWIPIDNSEYFGVYLVDNIKRRYRCE